MCRSQICMPEMYFYDLSQGPRHIYDGNTNKDMSRVGRKSIVQHSHGCRGTIVSCRALSRGCFHALYTYSNHDSLKKRSCARLLNIVHCVAYSSPVLYSPQKLKYASILAQEYRTAAVQCCASLTNIQFGR